MKVEEKLEYLFKGRQIRCAYCGDKLLHIERVEKTRYGFLHRYCYDEVGEWNPEWKTW